MIVSVCGHTEDPKEYNANVAQFRLKGMKEGFSTGCVGALACECCGAINGGTCLCAGIFQCANCGFENGKVKIEFNRKVSEAFKNSTDGIARIYLKDEPRVYYGNY